jgi:hypothetical protein
VSRLALVRPVTIRIPAIEPVLLVSAAASYAVFLQLLHDLLVNTGALILGIWGIRAILADPDVPGLTSIDLALSLVIALLLTAITVRMLLYAKRRSDLHSREE